MPTQIQSHPPRWYAIPARVLLVTFIGTLIAFALSLLLGIVGLLIIGIVRGGSPQMAIAYRHIALPAAAVAGSIIFVMALGMEIRHYRQHRTLLAIERAS